jgi:hypothetical protein
MAFFQSPFEYYYADGIFDLMVVIPYLLIGTLLTAYLLFSYIKYPQTNTRYHLAGLLITPAIGITSMFAGIDMVEKLDWHLRFTERNRLVNEIKAKRLCPDAGDREVVCKLPKDYFPPISVGGNKIIVTQNKLNVTSVEFLIDGGFLDHYMAFLYTNDKDEIANMDSIIKVGSSKRYTKLAPNWYRVAR